MDFVVDFVVGSVEVVGNLRSVVVVVGNYFDFAAVVDSYCSVEVVGNYYWVDSYYFVGSCYFAVDNYLFDCYFCFHYLKIEHYLLQLPSQKHVALRYCHNFVIEYVHLFQLNYLLKDSY